MWYKKKIELPEETIYEIVSGEDNQKFGLAVADIIRSRPHFHRNTAESYTLLSGCLVVYIDGRTFLLEQPNSVLKIPVGTVHWAESLDRNSPARISVATVPAWTPEDHILI